MRLKSGNEQVILAIIICPAPLIESISPSSSIALAKLLHHGVTTNDSRITEITITVEDDSDLTNGDGCIRTRSQRGALQYRVKEISILVKILKLLIYELSNCLESAMAFADDDDDNDTDGEVKIAFMIHFSVRINFFVLLHLKAERGRHA